MDAHSHLPTEVLAHYDLGKVHAQEPKVGGGIDESFVVTSASGRIFFKRRSTDYSPEMVECDHALIEFLVSHTFPTPALVPTLRGESWVEWEGRVYEAYTFVEGSGYVPGDLRQISSLGRTVGRYHHMVSQYHPARLKPPPWQHTSVARFLDIDGYASPRLRTLAARGWIGEREAQFVRDVTTQLRDRADQVEDAAMVSLTIHGALEPGNVLFGKGDKAGQVVAWVDWADSGLFVRAFDVAYALLKFAGHRPDAVLPGQVGPSLPWSSVQSFAMAYRQEVKLSEAESALLPWLMLAVRIVDALWVSERQPQDHRRELSLARELRDWLAQNGKTLTSAFH
jgi:Ser/Thr protein kinase RdoA (MazF antagonist)